MMLDNKLKFDKHVENICQKASRILHALARVTNYMELPKRRILMNAFFKAKFDYCPAAWMFHSRSLNNKKNQLHERCIRIGAITKVEKSVGWSFDRDFCYCKGAATCQNLITSCIIPLGVMYLLVIMLDQYKVSVEHHWI